MRDVGCGSWAKSCWSGRGGAHTPAVTLEGKTQDVSPKIRKRTLKPCVHPPNKSAAPSKLQCKLPASNGSDLQWCDGGGKGCEGCLPQASRGEQEAEGLSGPHYTEAWRRRCDVGAETHEFLQVARDPRSVMVQIHSSMF